MFEFDPTTSCKAPIGWLNYITNNDYMFLQGYCSTVTNGLIYLFGTDYNVNSIVEAFNPGTNIWTNLGTMASAPYFSGCAPLAANPNKILVILASGVSGYDSAIYDVNAKTWTYVADPYNDFSCGLTQMGPHLCMNSCGLNNKFNGCNKYIGGVSGTTPAWSPITAGSYVLGSRYAPAQS